MYGAEQNSVILRTAHQPTIRPWSWRVASAEMRPEQALRRMEASARAETQEALYLHPAVYLRLVVYVGLY